MFLQILNTEGLLYSFNFQSRALRWIQDLTSLDKVMTVVPGNSRCLYIVFPRKSIVVGLDVATGNVSWNQSIGPLSNEKSFPTVDNNGKEMPYFVIIQIIFILTGFYFSKIHCAHSIFVFHDYLS